MIDWTKNLSPTRTCHLTIASSKLFATRGMLLTPPLLKLRLLDPKNWEIFQEVVSETNKFRI